MLPDSDNFTEDQVDQMLDGWVEDIDGGKRVLRLEYPVEIKIGAAGKKAEPVEIIELVFRRPKASILDKANNRDRVKAAREMIASVVEAPVEGVVLQERHIGDLDMADFTRASLVLGRFFPKPPATGSSGTGES